MQNITDSEFQREVEALKAHRRTSVNRPLLDPDLPEIAAAHGGARELLGSDDGSISSPSSSPSSNGLFSSNRARLGVNLSDDGPAAKLPGQKTPEMGRVPFTARRRGADSTDHPQLSPSGRVNNENAKETTPSTASSDDDTPLTRPLDPSHLFWVPASMHPEISPSDFRRFLHDHTSRAVREQQEQEALGGSDSVGSSLTTGSNSGSSNSASRSSANGNSIGITSPLQSSANSPTNSPVDALMNRSTSIARRGSTLRRQYRPENDQEDEGPFAAIKGKRYPTAVEGVGSTSQYGGGLSTLTIDDLQKLEQLAEEASKSSDPTELRSVLRRTMSLTVAHSALDQVDDVPVESEQDAPLIVPRPGQILRRAARTKIRKASFSGEVPGGGPRTGAGVRRRGATGGGLMQQSMNESRDSLLEREGAADTTRQSLTSDASDEDQKRKSDGQNDSMLDSYISEEDSTLRTSVHSSTDSVKSMAGEATTTTNGIMTHASPQTPTQQSISSMATQSQESDGSVSYFDNSKGMVKERSTSSSSSVGESGVSPIYESPVQSPSEINYDATTTTRDSIRPVHVQHVPPILAFEKARPAPMPPATPTVPPPTPAQAKQQRKGTAPTLPAIVPGHAVVRSDTMPNMPTTTGKPGKEKKSGFGLSWFGLGKEEDEKSSKKEKKERKEREREREKEREAEALMYGHHAHSSSSSNANSNSHEKEPLGFLGALFGKKKGGDDHGRQDQGSAMYSQAGHVTAGSLLDMQNKGSGPHYYRYPIHVERAVYRLSHIKLANPRRPLYEQVLISNLMFWYLSIINRSQQQQQVSQTQEQAPPQAQQASSQQQQQQQQPSNPQQQYQPQQQQQPHQMAQQSHSYVKGEPSSAPISSLPPVPAASTMRSGEESLSMEVEGDQLEDGQMVNGLDGGGNADTSTLYDGSAHVKQTQSTGSIGLMQSASSAPAPQQQQQQQQQQYNNYNSNSNNAVKQAPSKTKRGGLVKPNRAPPGSRSAEIAIPAVGYGAQHRQINSELANSASAVVGLNATSIGSNGYGGGISTSLSVGQIVDPRSIAGYSMSGAGGGGGGGVVYDHVGGSTGNFKQQTSGDEHAWLGGRDRRSPGAEERRSEPFYDSNQFRDARGGGGTSVKSLHRVSEPTGKGEDSTYRTFPTTITAPTPAQQRVSGDSSVMDSSGITSSPSSRSLGSNTSATSSSLNHTSMSSSSNTEKLNGMSFHEDAAPYLPMGSLAGNNDNANAMLDAARSSQSRRR
ncbi:hypothetical protein CBS101457_005610 [Exobasidium rhododendri]|nr:hypothetical protein CBS101457_005610 [Exobasidium rhododendri]